MAREPVTSNTSHRAYLVFGAYGGIGSALCRALARDGNRLAVSGRDVSRLEPLAAEVDALSLAADATDFDAVDVAVSRAVESFGRLDGVAACVGSLLLKPAHLTKPEEWHDALGKNLTSAFAILRAAARPMMEQKDGAVVLVSTAAASIGLANHEAIAAAKGGIDALARSAAATYGRSGIRVNAVAPGLVDTPMTARITGNDRALQSSRSMHALGRIGQPEDVVEAIRWLLGPEASWVTGQTVGVDGGLARARAG